MHVSRSSLLGSITIPLLPSKMIRLISSNSRSVQNWISSCYEGVSERKIVPKLKVLMSDWNDVSQENRAVNLCSIDGQLQRVMKCTEKNYRKLRAHIIEFSPELSKLGIRWKFWRKVVYHKQGRFGNTEHLQATAKHLQINSYKMHLASTIVRLKNAKLDYLHHKKQHTTLRDKYVNSSLERKEELKTLRKREKSKNKWKRCRLDFGKSRKNSTSEVEREKEGVIVRMSNKFEMERAIMK